MQTLEPGQQRDLEPAPRLPRTLKRPDVLWIGGVASLVVAWLLVLWAFRAQPGDDPFITYRYAWNLAAGRGFVFNPGEHVQSTTTPLFTIFLAGVSLLGLDIPTFGYLASALCLLAFAWFCVRLVSLAEGAPPWLGLAASVLTVTCIVTTYGLGTEMPLLIALAWGCWWALARDKWYVAGLLAGLAAITRGDGILIGIAAVLVFVWSHRAVSVRKWPWGAALVFLAVALPWYLFAWGYFGSPLPATLGAKVAQGSAPGTVPFFDGLGFFWSRAFADTTLLWLVAAALLVVGLVVIVRRGVILAPVWVWALLFIAGFSLLRVPRYPWYYTPLVPVAMLALVYGGYGLGSTVQRLARAESGSSRAPATGAAIVTLLTLVSFSVNDVRGARPEPTARSRLYRDGAAWLSANTPPSASVGAEEVGFLGYYSGRRIVDFVGLIQPDVAPHRAAGDNLWSVQKYKPDFILAFPPWLASVGSDPWVKSHYSAVRTFEVPGSDTATLLRLGP